MQITRTGRRALVTIVAGLAALLGCGLLTTAEASAPTDPNVYIACGYGETSVGASDCESLPQAVAAVEASASTSPATIELMPGDFCPLVLSEVGLQRSLTIVGVGPAAFGGSFASGTGAEAGMSAFKWSTADCGTPFGSLVLLDRVGEPSNSGVSVSLRNLAIDGSGTSPGQEPENGLAVNGNDVSLRDVIVENVSGLAISDSDAGLGTTLDVDDSAVVDGGTTSGTSHGFDLSRGSVSIANTTVAGEYIGLTSEGFARVDLDNDTIAENAIGVDPAGPNQTISAANTIIAGNTTIDCATPGVFTGSYDLDNLVGGSPSLCTLGASDIAWNGTGLTGSLDDGDGPTPWLGPPSQATGAGDPDLCDETGTDQRERLLTSGGPCDIGAVQITQEGNGTPAVDVEGDGALGSFAAGDPAPTADFTVSNSGGGLLYGYSTAVTGPFAVTADDCTYAVLDGAAIGDGQSCHVTVAADTNATGDLTGTLTIDTGVGAATVDLSASGPPAPPGSDTGTSTDTTPSGSDGGDGSGGDGSGGGSSPAPPGAGGGSDPGGSTLIALSPGAGGGGSSGNEQPAVAADTHPPSAPSSFHGSLAGVKLALTWKAASDDVGVDHYELYRNGKPLQRLAGSARSVRVAPPAGASSTYAVRAFDAAGNESAASQAVRVSAARRPTGLPHAIPGWARHLLAYDRAGKHGHRPQAPRHLPAWFAAWQSYELHPFHTSG